MKGETQKMRSNKGEAGAVLIGGIATVFMIVFPVMEAGKRK